MNPQLVLVACGVFVAFLAYAFNFYLNHEKLSKTSKIIFIFFSVLLFSIIAYFLLLNLFYDASAPEISNSLTDQMSQQKVNLPPTVISLASDESSPKLAGAKIHWTATASDPENDPLNYRFYLDGQPKTDWSNNPTWTWTTSITGVMSHVIEVRVKDSKHDLEGDGSKARDFVIEAPSDESQVVNTPIIDKESNSRIEVQVDDENHANLEITGDQADTNSIIVDSNPVISSNSSTNSGFNRKNEYVENGVQPNCEPGSVQAQCSSPDTCVDCNGKCWPLGSYDSGKKICSRGKWTLTGYMRTNEYVKNGVEPDCEPGSEQAQCSSPDSCVDCNGKCWSPGGYDSASGKMTCSRGKWTISWVDRIYK